MRFFAVSDLHVDYGENATWVERLSKVEYLHDVLILAGDVSDVSSRLAKCLELLVRRFWRVLFVPGNHELWMVREAGSFLHSLDKFVKTQELVLNCGALTGLFQAGEVTVVPLLGWYDYSFGEPGDELRAVWMDYRACRWPAEMTDDAVARYFERLNGNNKCLAGPRVITFSHFLPRIDLMPEYIPARHKQLYPVLGSTRLERQLRAWHPMTHLYGHSHVNQSRVFDGIRYVNNALGYPGEARMTSRRLLCVYEN